MNIQFWGVRGSIPTPITPEQIKSKISEAVKRITAKDIESPEARENFLLNLPEWIFGTVGGNTPCVELKSGDTKIIFDCGSGMRGYGKTQRSNKRYHIFLSHFHWDHIQGLPFFDPAYDPNTVIDFYSPFPDAKEFLSEQMKRPFYPVPFEAFTKNFNFHTINHGDEIKIDGLTITSCSMNHPGNSYSYAVCENGRKFVYATDDELKADGFDDSEVFRKVFYDADVLLHDSQYTVVEALKKPNWGHSPFCFAVDFAAKCNIKELYLFHHEPTYDDEKLDSILRAARWYARYCKHTNLKINLARESEEIAL